MSDSSFAALDLPEPLLRALAELGLTTPTPIQAAAIPAQREGRDVLGRSDTGSGKTLAFGLPLLAALSAERRLQALILCPTRELGAQVARELRRVGRHLAGLRIVELCGGQPLAPQARTLALGAHVAVGTPGRVGDLGRRGALDLSGLRVLVLDEADRMLDMGFADQVGEILDATPPDAQRVLFSATFPPEVEALVGDTLRDPERVEAGGAPPRIHAIVVPTDAEHKPDALLAVLAHHEARPALVFCGLKATTEQLAAHLRAHGHAAAALHGDLDQDARNVLLARLRNGGVRVVVATDVAARGLDVDALDLVVLADVPGTPEAFVHRAGRTGRKGREGRVVLLASPRDEARLARIEAASGVTLHRSEALDSAPVSPPASAAPMVTLRLGGGRKDKVRPGDLLGALTGEGGFTAADVGRIEIHDHFTFLAVPAPVAERVLAWLREGRVKGRRFQVGRVG